MIRQIIPMVMVLLAVLVASCDITDTKQLEQKPEPVPDTTAVLIDVADDADSTRIKNASIAFKTVGEDPVREYNDEVVATNGIFDRLLPTRDVMIDVYAYAEGYQPSDTIRINLDDDVRETFYLTKEEGEPDPDGPGHINVSTPECIDDEAIGRVFGTVENGFVTIKLLDADSREVIREKEGLSPTDDQEFEFSDVPNGTYIVVASRDNGSDPSESDSVTLNCEVQEGPGQIDITASSCSDPDQANGLLTITIENGADTLTTTRNGDIVDERYDVAAGEEVELIELTAGDYEITAVKNGKPTEVTETIDTCEVKEGPGKIDIKTNSCSDPDQPTGVLAFTIENGADSLRVDRDEEMVAELSDIAPGERIELTEVAAGDYQITAFLNKKEAQENETVTTCDQPKPPKARYSSDADGFTVTYDASASSTENGEIEEYAWDWTNDGTIDEVTTEPIVSHTFDEEGLFTTRLRVKDTEGLTDETTGEVNPYQPNRDPNVDFSTNTDGLTVGLDNGSTDPDGDDLSCTWEFGDGNDSNEFHPGSHDYSTGGEYDITLTCEDPDGASDSKTKTITVEEKQGPSMIKELKTVCSAVEDGSVKIRTRNGFSSISLMQGQTVVQYHDNLPVEEHQEFTFQDVPAGTYTVVPELNGETNEKEVTVDQCTDPEASFTSEADGFTVNYDASGSSTENGEIEQYEWDWKDDGTIDEVTTTPQPSFEFDEVGPFTTRLRITDSRGLTAETTGKVNPYQPNRAPYVKFDVEVEGRTGIFNNKSTDPDGDDLSCTWDYDNGDTANVFEQDYTWSEYGEFEVVLNCEDPDGASDSYSETVILERELSELITHRIRIFADRKVWVSDHKDRPEDKLLHYEGARPIMTEQDPFGTVRMKTKLKSEVNGHSFLRIFFNEDETDYIQTPILDVESGTDGWTTVEVEIDAEEFAGRARDLAGFRVIHGDEINDSKPEGPDKVIFATADVEGEVTFYWRVELDGSQGKTRSSQMLDLKYEHESDAYLK